MPDTEDDDRLLEETFRAVLAAALGAGVAIKLFHDGEPTDTIRDLPLILLSARHLGEDLGLTGSAGDPMSEKELRIECRVDGTKAQSAATAEGLAAQVLAAAQGITAGDCGDWEMVDDFEHTGTERGVDGGVRLVTHIFTMLTLRAV